MPKVYKRIRIFAASPGDVGEERRRLATVVESMNRSGALAERMGFILELLRWETHVAPDAGEPQAVVFGELHPEDWDVFVGILWTRFGTQTGNTDPDTGRSYRSGTEEEFKAALRQRDLLKSGKPKIMFYRCVRPIDPRNIESDQIRNVQEFFEEFEAAGKHPGLLSDYETVDGFERIVRNHLEQFILDQPPMEPFVATPPKETRSATAPGVFRFLLDRYLPRLHTWLTKVGVFPMPPEWHDQNQYLRRLSSSIAGDIRAKTYIEPSVKAIPETADRFKPRRAEFLSPIQRMIKEIVGVSHGGDAQSAQISALSRKCRFVRNIVKRLMKADEPLVLLGDPGSGKSLTLQQAGGMMIADRESHRIFPDICLFVRLGEFHVSGTIDDEAIWEYIRRSTPPQVRPYLEALDDFGRLIILFDGMDEMSRDRYNEHTAALSVFAGSPILYRRTLFSCRITDFTPEFQHNRLVLLPFRRRQIYRYLKRQNILLFPKKLGGRRWSARQLANRLSQGGLPMQADNPFILWLLCNYLQDHEDWPKSRVHLLEYYNRSNYDRKLHEAARGGGTLPAIDHAFLVWGRIAYEITNRNRGAAIPLDAVTALLGPAEVTAVEAALHCGVLQKSLEQKTTLVRFEHHRFQEYFTAYYLSRSPDLLSTLTWLDRLDAPRWQETLFNLVLMSGGREALISLADAINQGIVEAGTTAGTPKAAEVERLLGDRVELAARVLQQAPEISAPLSSTFQKSTYFLADHGNPISQVKMLWASKIVTDIDIFRVARLPLRSNISWVRHQALIITSSAGGKVAGGALQEDVSLSFASGRFFNRLASYVRIGFALKQPRFWWTIGLGLLISLIYVLGSYELVRVVRRQWSPMFFALENGSTSLSLLTETAHLNSAEKEQDQEKIVAERKHLEDVAKSHDANLKVAFAAERTIESRWFDWALGGTMLLVFLYTMRRKPGLQVAASQLAGYACLVLPFVLWPLLLGNWGAFFTLLFESAFVASVISSTSLAVMLAFDAMTILGFAASAFPWMRQGPKTRMLLEAMWQDCGYPYLWRWFAGIGGGVLGVTAFAGLVSLLTVPQFQEALRAFLLHHVGLLQWLPLVPNVTLSLALYLQAACLSIVLALVWKRRFERAREVATESTALLVVLSLSVILLWSLTLLPWGAVWNAVFATAAIFRSLPPVVNGGLSALLYFDLLACLRALLGKPKGEKLATCLLWTLRCSGIAVTAVVIWQLIVVNWLSVWTVLLKIAFLPFLPTALNFAISVIIVVELTAWITALALRLGGKADWEGTAGFLKSWTKWSLAATGVSGIAWGLYRFSDNISLALALIIEGACAGCLLYVVLQLSRQGVNYLEFMRGPRGGLKFRAETWRHDLARLSPEAQAARLRHTTAGALGLSVSDFLSLFQAVESVVKAEPATSAYWAKRYELEQIVRQELSG